MAKSIKLKGNTYWDTKGIIHNEKLLSDILYPIGSIYLSVNSINPSTLFGGAWEQLSGGYLYATTTEYFTTSYIGTGTQSKETFTSGSTTLTANQSGLRPHTHSVQTFPFSGGDAAYYCVSTSPGGNVSSTHWRGGYAENNDTQDAIEGHTHSIPAHSHNIATIAVYVWKRVS